MNQFQIRSHYETLGLRLKYMNCFGEANTIQHVTEREEGQQGQVNACAVTEGGLWGRGEGHAGKSRRK